MLYLAKVFQQEDDTGEVSLQLLARQKSEHHWAISSNQSSITVSCDACTHSLGKLVLVTLTRDRQVESIQDATNWVLNLVEQYLVPGISPNLLHEEAARAEEWRKDLTLKSQDLARRTLELETRRDQIQELEKKLEAGRQQTETPRTNDKPDEKGAEQSTDQNQHELQPIDRQSPTEEDTYSADVAQP